MRGTDNLRAAVDHVRYVERDGVEKDGGKGIAYAAGDHVNVNAFVDRMTDDPHQFRFIVSPEDAGELDLTDFVKRLMAKMEDDLGRKLDWVASNHWNTDNPHAHVIVRGRDADGKFLYIDNEYISRSMRYRAQDLATLELGPRSELEIGRQVSQEVSKERFTNIDREIGKHLVEQVFDIAPFREEARNPVKRNHVLGRLETLERLALAERVSSTSWRLSDDWEARLRALGERGDILKKIHQALKGDLSKYRVLGPDSDTPAGVIEGVIREKGLHRELHGQLYAVVESQSGTGYYVPLDKKSARQVREGDFVTLDIREDPWVKKADEIVAGVAIKAGGVYRSTEHLRELGDGPVRLEDGRLVEPKEFVTALERRLGRLERFGLVSRSGEGAWAVRPGLLEDLRARDQSHPRKRLDIRKQPMSVLEQRTYKGPTWLDRLPATAARAGYGFGAEVARAIQHREVFLRSFGIDPSAPEADRIRALRALERKDLGERLARESKAAFVVGLSKTGGPAFRGKLTLLEALPSGQRYAQVVDESRKRFVLLPATKDLRAFVGKAVELVRDPKTGKVVAREPGINRGA